MKILFCIASAQTAQNINPLSEINPDKVIVIATTKIKQDGQAQNLINSIQDTGIKAEEFSIQNESSLKSLTEQFSDIIENHIDDELIANITGGTKLMSISLYQLFSNWGFRSFYCNHDSSELIWLDDESAIGDIGSKIGLKQYLKAYQVQIGNYLKLSDIEKAQKDYANLLYSELCKPTKYEKMCQLIGKIHALTAQNALSAEKQAKFRFDDEEYAFVSHLSHETGLFKLNGDIIKPVNQDIKKFMNGAWLEFLVGDNLRGGEFRDISLSVEISKSTKRISSETRQEIDVMAMHQDKLIIIECKAKKWENATDASEAIYKLSALGNIGGINTVPIFVSLRDIPAAAKTRGAEMGVKVIAGQADIITLGKKGLIDKIHADNPLKA